MEKLTEFKRWLMESGLAEDLSVDSVGAVPGDTGLFPTGARHSGANNRAAADISYTHKVNNINNNEKKSREGVEKFANISINF